VPLLERQAALVERCAQLEAKYAQLDPLRERVAAAEARPPVPRPARAPRADGLTVDQLKIAQDADDPRVVTIGYRDGETVKTLATLHFPTTLYCGVFDGGRKGGYARGDEVTYQGALWHCNAATTVRPGLSDAWTLAVK